MNKLDLFIGIIIGLLTTAIGMFAFITMYTPWDFINGIKILQQQEHLGQVICLGSILNMIIFAILYKKKKDLMAKGVILSVILLTILTLFL
ncbi:hypothetical protein [Flavobacterium sp.]|uniref:hypothetical protein n=1 Tax=Flavobacterium sp. TaxID=239 RepID=UPI003C5F1A34